METSFVASHFFSNNNSSGNSTQNTTFSTLNEKDNLSSSKSKENLTNTKKVNPIFSFFKERISLKRKRESLNIMEESQTISKQIFKNPKNFTEENDVEIVVENTKKKKMEEKEVIHSPLYLFEEKEIKTQNSSKNENNFFDLLLGDEEVLISEETKYEKSKEQPQQLLPSMELFLEDESEEIEEIKPNNSIPDQTESEKATKEEELNIIESSDKESILVTNSSQNRSSNFTLTSNLESEPKKNRNDGVKTNSIKTKRKHSFRDSAYLILKKEGKPLTASSILKIALEEGKQRKIK